jgi:hypothetical protein
MAYTIADARRLQRDLGLLESHVIYADIGSDWFVIAHTGAERGLQALSSLAECSVRRYLALGGLDRRVCCTGLVLPGCPRFVFPRSGWYEVPTASLHDVRGLAL